MKLQRKSNK